MRPIIAVVALALFAATPASAFNNVYAPERAETVPVPLPERNPVRPDTRQCLSAEKVLPVIEETVEKVLILGEQYNHGPYTPVERNQKKMELIASFFKIMVETGT